MMLETTKSCQDLTGAFDGREGKRDISSLEFHAKNQYSTDYSLQGKGSTSLVVIFTKALNRL
jgi:hypothetical protein